MTTIHGKRPDVFAVWLACAVLVVGLATPIMAGVCGDGIVDSNEECDPGGELHCNGDPSLTICTTGAQCGGGVNCYFATSCCKFNCQFVGQGADCFDGNSCTAVDTCDQVGRCVGTFLADGTPCQDGLFCNGTDTCAAGECDGHAGDPCVEATDCQTTCNEDADACLSTPSVPCGDDGNACTDDVCDGIGTCTHPPLPAGTVCRAAATVCDVAETCSGSNAPCPADAFVTDGTPCGDACTAAGGTCQSGQCTGGVPVMCDDNDVCNGLETCDSFLGCQPGTSLDCNDGDSCTSDPCDPTAGCSEHIPLPDNTPCEDDDECTLLDLCKNDTCVGGPTFLGEKKAKVVNDATINADFAAFDAKAVAAVGKRSFMADGTTISGDKVKIGKSSSVDNVRGNKLAVSGVTIRGSQSGVTVPLGASFCPTPTVTCGGENLFVLNLEIRTLDPGTYGTLRIGEGAIVNFKPGVYTFCQVIGGRDVRVNFLGSIPSHIRVDRKFVISNGTIYGPAAGVPRPTIEAARGLVKFGGGGDITTNIVAPAATVKIFTGSFFDGSICARELKGAWHLTLSCT